MKFAMMFPGQGSQYIGMCQKFIKQDKQIAEIFEEASEILGFDLKELIDTSTMKVLTLSENAQPAVLATSYALYKLFEKQVGQPSYLVGHSLGEISALVCAGGIAFKDAIFLARQRGKLMQDALKNKNWGAGVVVDLSEQAVEEIIDQIRPQGYISISGYNSPKQFMIAGERKALELLDEQVDNTEGQFIPFRMIPMKANAPYHSSLMSYCINELEHLIKRIQIHDLDMKVYSTVLGDVINIKEEIPQILINQLVEPIRWNQAINKILENQVEYLIDIGPNCIMHNLIKERQDIPKALAYDNEEMRLKIRELFTTY